MTSPLTFLPAPRQLSPLPGVVTLSIGRHILLQGAEPGALLFTAKRLQAALREHAGVEWPITATPEGPLGEIGVTLRVTPGRELHPQGYELTITDDQVIVEAATPAGVFYGVCTLIQVLEQSGRRLPCLRALDAPDFAARGVMLDVSRDKVPTMATLYGLVDMLAGWKINQLQLYTEHTFAYRNHPDVWARASPITGEEILELDAYCRERFVELVPNQNSFGHMARWLVHPRYHGLAETHGEFETPWGFTMKGPFSLAPEDPGSLALVTSLFDELLPHFSSRLVNVGCDETVDLGQGRSAEVVKARGEGRVYLEFLRKIYAAVTERGRTMQFWGDIINHYPELIPELPKDAVALEWGYEADHPFARNCPRFAEAGLPFYVCGGTSAWNTVAGRTDNALGNLLNAAESGLASGAAGFLNTDWGDNGHWQTLPVSFLGFAAGAAFSWALGANRGMDVPAVVSHHAFGDPSGAMGRVAYDMGNIYRLVGVEPPNSSALFWVLQEPPGEWRLPPLSFEPALEAIDAAMRAMAGARMRRSDAAQIAQEYELAARMLRHACRRGQLLSQAEGPGSPGHRRLLDEDMREIIREYERLWLARNRPGGLAESVARLEGARAAYQA
jgi:hexosaminidase